SWRGGDESYAGLETVLGYLALFLATRALCRHPVAGRRLLAAVVPATAVASAYALVQLAGLDPVTWDNLSLFAGRFRPFSTLGHPNFLAAYLVLAVPLTAAHA